MIELENTEVVGWEAAIRGMRNPMNSWERSDSQLCKSVDGFEDCRLGVHGSCPRGDEDYFKEDIFCVGKNDFELMQRLARAGTDHRKFMRMIVVYVDVTAPLYWWKEFKTYRAGKRWGNEEPDAFVIPSDYSEYDIEMNSCSTMHKIHAKEFTMGDFSCEKLLIETQKGEVEIRDQFGEGTGYYVTPFRLLGLTVRCLNEYRDLYLQTGDKMWWEQMIQSLPSSYNQRRTLMLNYEVLANIYRARRNHKLTEWREFCRWIETLPYSELITGGAE